MWQKLVAGVCVMTGAVGFGLALCGEMSSEIRHLKLQKQIVSYMKGEIAYLRRPMEEVLDIISERMEPPYDIFLEQIAQRMKERSGKGLMELWKEEVYELKMKSDIPVRASGYLERIGECFGCEGDRLQVQTLELFERELDMEIDKRLQKRKENDRLVRVLSTLAGILGIVFFL